jgi:hemin uptake protein HemP
MESTNNQSRSDFQNDEKKDRLYESPELFGKLNEIMIRHKGDIYRIRITRNDKLIMNK